MQRLWWFPYVHTDTWYSSWWVNQQSLWVTEICTLAAEAQNLISGEEQEKEVEWSSFVYIGRRYLIDLWNHNWPDSWLAVSLSCVYISVCKVFKHSVNPTWCHLNLICIVTVHNTFFLFVFILLEHSLLILSPPPHLDADTCVGRILFPDVMSFPLYPLLCMWASFSNRCNWFFTPPVRILSSHKPFLFFLCPSMQIPSAWILCSAAKENICFIFIFFFLLFSPSSLRFVPVFKRVMIDL